MPEGDTVRRTAERLQRALAGSAVTGSDFRVPSLATADLGGRTVLESTSRGKHLLLRLSDGVTLHTHLRMEGSWRLFAAGRRWTGGPGWQVRLVLHTERWQAVGYRLPVVELLPTALEADILGHLGPDVLGPASRPGVPRTPGTDSPGNALGRQPATLGSGRPPLPVDVWDEDEAIRRLAQRPQRPIVEALLDQRNLAGIGNLWAGETCFLRGTNPWTPVAAVELTSLLRLVRRMMHQAASTGLQVTTGHPRRGEDHWVYGRHGSPCRRCGTPIQLRNAVSGEPYARQTWWCPRCQPLPDVLEREPGSPAS